MEKEKSGNRILRRTTKMPTTAAAASASNTQDVVASAAAASSPGGSSSVAMDSSPSRPSSPTATTTASSSSSSTAPAPLAAAPVSAAYPKYHYSRDELLSLKSCPLSKLKPKFLTPVHELCDICLELDSMTSVSSRNTFDEQTSMRPGIASKRQSSLGDQRSSVGQLNNDCDADAHIVLVPQRSSFGTGCHVAPGRNVNSPEAKRERNRRDGHRIGSGRIQISEKYVERELHDHRVQSDRERDRNDRWYDRCGNGTKMMKRDYDGRRSEAYRDGRYMGDSGRSGAEPEWFTEGPMSQSDTIELHGFESLQKSKSASKERLVGSSGAAAPAGARDEAKTLQLQQPNSLPKAAQVVVTETAAVPRENKEREPSVFSDAAEGRNGVRGGEGGGREEEEDQSTVSMVTDPANPLSFVSGKDVSSHPPAVPTTLPPPDPPPAPHQTSELDFNAFFNADSIPGLNDLFSLEPEQAKSGSRFQQWFHFSSHGNSHCESRRSSLTDEFGYINDIIYGHNSPLGQMSPPPPNPLPPAAAGHGALCGSQPTFSAEKYSDETQNLLEMLQKANADGCIGTVPFNGRRDATMAAAAENRTMNYCMSNQGDGGRTTDARDVEAGLKAILSGAVFGNSPLLSLGLTPSMAASLVLPVGTKVTLLSDLEAGLKGLSIVNGNHGGIVHAASQPLLGGASDCHSNSLPPSGAVGRPASSSQGGDDEAAAMVGQLMSSSGGSVFAGRPTTDLAAYKKLLGLIVEPHGCQQTVNNNSLPIVTSPTSVSMSNLEANQPNNSLANNQRDFIQRYLLQQQQLKMLHHHQQPPPPPPPPPPEGGTVFAPQPPPQSCLPPHLLPPRSLSSDLPPQSYLSPGMLSDPTMMPPPSGLLIGPAQQGRTDFALSPGAELPQHHQQHQHQPQPQGSSSCGYRDRQQRSGLLGLSLNLPPSASSSSDDPLAALLPGFSADFSAHPYLPSHHHLPGGGQAHLAMTTTRGSHCPGTGQGQMIHGSLLPPQQQQYQHQQQHHEMTSMTTTVPISQLSTSQANKHHLLLQESAKQAIHQASFQQQLARMTHLALHDPFGNSTKLSALSPHPVLPPHLTLQPPPVSSHPSPVGLSMLGPQSLLQQPPQSPRRAPSPIMFGNQPPMNLTAPLPLHLGPMTPILSPTPLSPNTLQVTQTGSNLSSPVMRVPSPQELSGLAQSILQNALIKKQLEEQKERFIRRQQERNKSPKPQAPSGPAAAAAAAAAMTTASSRAAAYTVAPSVLSQSFLPTSVLRKMASSKADERTRLTDSSLSCSGKKMPEHLSLGSAASTSKSKASDYHHQLQQQQQFFAGGSSCSTNTSSSNSRAAALNLHAMEMAKLLEQQQRKSLLSSPMPPVPSPAITTQFVSAGPENGAYGVAPLPRMLVHPTFGVNSQAAAAAASNALLLQRLAYPNHLQRGGLSSVNHLNLNQLALMQAVQLQAQQQQQQQQQQQLWNRNAAVRSVNNRGPYPAAFAAATSSLPAPSTATTVVAASSSNKPGGAGGGGGGRVGGVSGVNGSLKTTSVGSAMQQMKADNDVFMSGTNLHQHLNDAANRSSEAASGLAAPGTDAGGRLMTSAEDEENGATHQQQGAISCRSDLASDVGNLAKWFGSDVFNHHLPPLVASAGQKVLTVDEIEGWQRAVGES